MSTRPNLKPKDSFHHGTNSPPKYVPLQLKEEEEPTTTSALKSPTTRLKSNHKTRLEIPNKNKPFEKSDETGSFQPPIDSIVKGNKVNSKMVKYPTVKSPVIGAHRRKTLKSNNEQEVYVESLDKQTPQEQRNSKRSLSWINKNVNKNQNYKNFKKEKTNMPTRNETKLNIKTCSGCKPKENDEPDEVSSGNNATQKLNLNAKSPKDATFSENSQNPQNDETVSENSPLNFTKSLKLVLHSNILSPQARSCLMLMKYLNLDLVVEDVQQLTCEHLSEDFQKINAWHMIPKLVHEDLMLTDSHTILMYLCVTFPSASAQKLFPACPLARLKIMNMLFFEAQVLYRRYSNFMTDIVRKEHNKIDFDLHKKKIFEAYEMLNGFLRNSRFLVGNKLTLADISMVATFSAMDLMMPLYSYKEYWPHLSNWFQRMREMPMYEPNNTGVMKQREIVRSFDKSLIPN